MTALIEIVQSTLLVMDSDEVDSIAGTTESMQVANIARDTYFELVERLSAATKVDWLHGPVTAVAAGDVLKPTMFTLTESVRRVTCVSYLVDEDVRELSWRAPDVFLKENATHGTGRIKVVHGGVTFYVGTTAAPTTYTTFDDTTFFCNSVNLSVESSLVSSKLSLLGYRWPSFSIDDTFTIDLPPHLIPLYQSEVNQACFQYLKQTASVVDTARSVRQMSQHQRDKNRVAVADGYLSGRGYGRR